MIILEGPDGSGKSTLAAKINRELGIPLASRASESISGPVKDLCGWVDRDLLSWGNSPVKVYDRYPLLSEPVYGPTLRGRIPEKMTTNWMRSRTSTFRSMALVIWCIPPFEAVDKNVCNSTQMEGVRDHIDSLWALYSLAAQTWSGSGMTYDYTSENTKPRDTHMINLIRRHITGWKHFK